VSFAVPAGSERVELSIHDVAGRLVRHLTEGATAPGVQRVLWDGRDESGRAVPGGIYFCRFVSGSERLAERIVLVR
jgi:flagellar hook assembly protein FlgD